MSHLGLHRLGCDLIKQKISKNSVHSGSALGWWSVQCMSDFQSEGLLCSSSVVSVVSLTDKILCFKL